MESIGYYVTVRDGKRTGGLLGPYQTHNEALQNVERGKALAITADAFACFYAFGTTKITTTGNLPKSVFGV